MTGIPVTPLPGYTQQSQANLDLVTEGKRIEERMLRYIDKLGTAIGTDTRFLAIGRTQIQLGCMAVYRAVMNPTRIALPEDAPAADMQSPAPQTPAAPETPPATPGGAGNTDPPATPGV